MKPPKVAMVLSIAFCAVAFKPGAAQPTIQEVAGNDDLQTGQVLSLPQRIQNGRAGRVHVDLGKSVFRLGNDSVATLSSAGFELETGNCLFANVSSDAPVTLARGAKSLQIVQGSGFAHRTDDRLLIGGMAGKMVVKISGQKLVIRPGEVMAWDAKGALVRSDFDLAQQVSTCALINDFTKPLPNAADLKREADRFASLEKRGFVRTRGKVVYDIDQRNPMEERVREAKGDFTIAAHNTPPSPSVGGIIERDGLIDDGFVGRPRPGGGSRADDDDGARPGGTKPGHGHGHTGPPGDGRPKPGKGNSPRR